MCIDRYNFLGISEDKKSWFSCVKCGQIYYKENGKLIPLRERKEEVDCASAPNQASSRTAQEGFLQHQNLRSSREVKPEFFSCSFG